MAISIRLSRGGSKKRPYYRIVVADARSPRDGRFIEKIGNYNPLLAKDNEQRVVLDAAGVRERAARENPNKGKPGEKATERAEERAEKLKAQQEAEAAAAAAPAPEPVAEEAPAADDAAPATDDATTTEETAA